MKHLATAAFIAGFAFVAATAARAQNLVVNGDFAANLNGWSFPDATPAWAAFDVDALPGSGSAYFANTQSGTNTRPYVLRQCISIARKGAYIFGASGYTPNAQPSSGNLVGSYFSDLHNSDCSGGYTAAGGFFMSGVGQWKSYSTSTAQNPALIVSLNPAASILIELGVDKPTAGGSFGGYFDAVYLIRDTLFQDGFE